MVIRRERYYTDYLPIIGMYNIKEGFEFQAKYVNKDLTVKRKGLSELQKTAEGKTF